MRYPTEWYVKMQTMLKEEKGQTMVEYALLIALIAILLMASIGSLKTEIANAFTYISNTLSGATGGTPAP